MAPSLWEGGDSEAVEAHGRGYKRDDNIVSMIFARADIFILPAVDMLGFDTVKVGTCSYKNHHVMDKEAGNSLQDNQKVGAEAVKKFMGRFNIKPSSAWRGMGCL